MLCVVLVCKLNDNTVNERFKYQCSIDVKKNDVSSVYSLSSDSKSVEPSKEKMHGILLKFL